MRPPLPPVTRTLLRLKGEGFSGVAIIIVGSKYMMERRCKRLTELHEQRGKWWLLSLHAPLRKYFIEIAGATGSQLCNRMVKVKYPVLGRP